MPQTFDITLDGQLTAASSSLQAIPETKMTQAINEQSIDAATAANSGSQTTNTSHDQQTINQQNNALFAQTMQQQNQLFTATMQQQQSLFQQHMAQVTSQSTLVKTADTVTGLALSGTITIIP